MSLAVWLPLNGNLENQGYSTVQVTNNGATIDNNGKIGKCYSFSSNALYGDLSTINNMTQASGCCWIYLTNLNSAQYFFHFGGQSSYPAKFSLDYEGSMRSQINGTEYTSGVTLNANTWYHVAFTWNGSSIKWYVNGEERASKTTSGTFSASNHFAIGARTNGTAGNTFAYAITNGGKLNDVRIYDHCLSPLEVKEISQGLVLHYKLDNNGWGNPNILLNTGFSMQYNQTTGWDTTKNGTLLASSWGGYNSGVSNASTVYHAHLKLIDNEYIYEYIKTANESWLGISQSGLQSKIVAGKTYTFSWEQYSVEGNNYNSGGLYYYKTGATSAGFHIGSFSGRNSSIGKWEKFSYTFTAPTDGDYSKGMNWYIYGTNGGNGILYTRRLKLEEGSVATPWCPNEIDELFKTISLNNEIVYDSSGYNNNGTIINTPTISSDTSRYSSSINFNGTADGILIENLNISNIINTTVTYSFWIKPNGENGARSVYFGSYSGTSWSIEKTAGNVLRSYWYGSPDETCTGATITDGVWQHICFVKDGTNSIKVYINGVQKWASTATHSNLTFPTTFRIGRDTRSNDGTPYKGLMSDFRIYCTALSAADIQLLYSAGARADNLGGLHVQEFQENNKHSVNKQCILNTTEVLENDTYSNIKFIKNTGTNALNFIEI